MILDNLPEGWKIVELNNFVEIETGKRAKGGGLSEGKIPSIGGEHIKNNGQIIWDNKLKFIPEEFYDRILKQGKVRLWDILIVKDGATTGKVAFVEYLPYEKVAVNEHIFIIRTNKNVIHNKFLYYFLFSKFGQQQIKLKFHGMIGGIKKEDIKSIKIPLPPLPEQKKIAEILSTVDKAIQNVDEIIAKTERLKRGLMEKLLTKGIGHKEFKYSEELGCEIPKEWVIEELGNLSIITSSKRIYVKDYREKGVPFYRGKEIIEKSQGKEVSEIYYISLEKYNEIKNKFGVPKQGDILITAVGTLSIPYLVKKLDGEFYFKDGNLLWIKKIKENKLNKQFFVQSFEYFFKKQKSKMTIGTTQNALTIEKLKIFKIPLPPLQEQQKIAEILSTVDKKLELERKRKKKLEKIKKGLMNDLLTGRKRVKNLNLEDD